MDSPSRLASPAKTSVQHADGSRRKPRLLRLALLLAAGRRWHAPRTFSAKKIGWKLCRQPWSSTAAVATGTKTRVAAMSRKNANLSRGASTAGTHRGADPSNSHQRRRWWQNGGREQPRGTTAALPARATTVAASVPRQEVNGDRNFSRRFGCRLPQKPQAGGACPMAVVDFCAAEATLRQSMRMTPGNALARTAGRQLVEAGRSFYNDAWHKGTRHRPGERRTWSAQCDGV